MAIKNILKTGKLFLWKKYKDEQKIKHPLSVLFWETSLNCNLRCLHCGSDCGTSNTQSDTLNTQEIKEALKEIAEDFGAKNILLTASGGEPLVRKDLFEVMGFARSLGYQWGMVTNGELLNKEVIKKIKDTELCSISVSLDGLKENHNWLRDKNIFDKVVKNITRLVKADFPMVEIITCVNQRNFSELEKIYELCLTLGVNAWRLFIITPVGRAKDNSELLLDAVQVKELLDFIVKKRKEKKIMVNFCDEGFLGTDYEGEVRDIYYFCAAGINVGSILYDGSVSACPILPRSLIQGSIRQDRFSKIWNEEFKIFRDSAWKKRGECKNCKSWDFCEGNSLHLWDFQENKPRRCHIDILRKSRC